VPEVIVVGSGIFGVSLAHRLALRGWRVTLVDAYPPGHVRGASGGESRLLRYAHGEDAWYTRSAWRARSLWGDLEAEAGAELLVRSGLVWFAHADHGWEADSERVLSSEGIPVERLPPGDAAGFFPDVDSDDLSFVLHEPEAGVLRARDAVRATFAVALSRGVRFVPGKGEPAGSEVVVDRERLSGDVVVWACGAWLPALFPTVVPIRVTKQDVFFFGAALPWQTPPVPGWVDYDGACYGLGDLDGRGVKVAPDGDGEPFEPEAGSRLPTPAVERTARVYLRRRFPALANAPLVGTRTCQYALTPDTNFLLDRHPEHERVWLFGGGSGHGFKHGPALGEYAADVLEDKAGLDDRFTLRARSEGYSLRTAGHLRGGDERG
jgi:sarcosine oxidase